MNVGVKLAELPEPGGEPVHADARGRCHAQFAVRSFAAVRELCAGGLKLHEYVMGGMVKDVARLGENEAAPMAMKQRYAELLLERRDLTRDGRLRQPKLLPGMGEAARLRGGMKDLQLVPVHAHGSHSAATAGSAST